jgi:ketosteroid isomerase-like protein
MTDRDTMLRTIDELYARRVAGDKAGIAAMLAPGATFRIAGDAIRGVPQGPGPAARSIAELIDEFVFHEIRRVDAVVEGNKLAVLLNARISRVGGEEINAELYDLWTFGADDKVTSGLQFGDTALVARLLA